MGKHEPMSAKAIANKIKAKGLQKLKYYCEMCKKQCRDDNGFKCHIMSESHQRQALIVSEDPDSFVNEFSKQFLDGFMFILRARYKTKRVLANTVFQEYIKERDHIHMNGTRWTTLTEFAHWLGEHGFVKVDESERGVMITYIDKDPETLRRKEIEARRAEQAKELARRQQEEIETQMKIAKSVYQQIEKEKPIPKPVPFIKVTPEQTTEADVIRSNKQIDDELHEDRTSTQQQPSTSFCEKETETQVIERPVFQVQAISMKSHVQSAYKPPPPKRKMTSKEREKKKKIKTD